MNSWKLVSCEVLAAMLFIGIPGIYSQELSTFAPKSMAYVLQADQLAGQRAQAVQLLAGCGRDLVVVDPAYTTGTDGQWTTREIEAIRAGKSGRKVVAYMSIGEAEDYRAYWRPSWDADKNGKPDVGAPKFLDVVNPDWPGNYKVRYWQAEWQKIILPYVDQVVAQGFDGIYLDIVDAFEFYEFDPGSKKWLDHRKNPETGNTYRQDMIAWVKSIARHARQVRPGFLVIPQNGAQLLEQEDYRNIISAIGVEDLLVAGKKLTSVKKMQYIAGFLQHLKPSGKPVLVIEYPKGEEVKPLAVKAAAERGYVLLMTDRNLKTLGTSGSKP